MMDKTRLQFLEEMYELKRQEIEPLRQRRNSLYERLLKVTNRDEFNAVHPELERVEAEFASQMVVLKQLTAEIHVILMRRQQH